ncbi:MAG: hypothetical protein H7281_14225 [Bacteriovorax sp.]|nr:hypothetical protein [Bacteriovorax sp.]
MQTSIQPETSKAANKQGYVAYPNINLSQEQYDFKQWANVYMNVIKYAPVKNSFFLKMKKLKNVLKIPVC